MCRLHYCVLKSVSYLFRICIKEYWESIGCLTLALEALHSSVLFLGVCWFYIELNKAMKVEHSHSCSWDGEVAFQPPLGLPICGTNIMLRARRCACSEMSPRY